MIGSKSIVAPSLCLAVAALGWIACADGSVIEYAFPPGGGEDGAADAGPELAGDQGPDVAEIAFCEGSTAHLYDPLDDSELFMYPDDLYARQDAASPTGMRLDVGEHVPWAAEAPSPVRSAFLGLGLLSGWGINAPLSLRFTGPIGPLPSGAEASVSSDALMLLDLERDPPERVPFDVEVQDEGRAVAIWPLRPLRKGVRHGLVMTTAAADAGGGCIAPSPAMRQLLTGDTGDERLLRLVPRYAELLEAAGVAPAKVSAATVFTTGADIGVMAEVAADLKTRGPYGWDSPLECGAAGGQYRACSGSFTASDYRDESGWISAAEPQGTWSIPVSVWLPSEGEGPFPTILFGHGLSSARGEGAGLAKRLCPLGWAVVSADALQHGDHPTAAGGSKDDDGPRFLGLDLTKLELDALDMVGNFNQTTVDRLQLIETMRAAPDVDGDGQDDLDIGRLSYFGISLGAILGPSLLALSDDVHAAVLSMAGGRLLTLATATPYFAAAKALLGPLFGSEAAFERVIGLAQTLVDAADPASYAPHVLRDRVLGPGGPPHVLINVSIYDHTVPPPSGRALARAFDIPHVAPFLEPVELIPAAPDAPFSGNLTAPDGSAVTAGFFQFNRVTDGEAIVESSHNNVTYSPEGYEQERRFLTPWLEGGVPEIIDPYAELGTGPLP